MKKKLQTVIFRDCVQQNTQTFESSIFFNILNWKWKVPVWEIMRFLRISHKMFVRLVWDFLDFLKVLTETCYVAGVP